MYAYQESTYYFDDFKVEEKVEKKIKVDSLYKAFALITAWIATHEGCWPEDLYEDDVLVEICTDIENDIQHCAKILFYEDEQDSHENQSV